MNLLYESSNTEQTVCLDETNIFLKYGNDVS